MALGSTQPLTEMNITNPNLPGGKGRRARKADNKMWQPRRLTTLRASMACYRDSFAFLPYDNCRLVALADISVLL
jgi:hypothetical protein